MSCSTIKSVNFSLCQPNLGGITKIYLANADEVSGVTIGTASTLSDEGITAITMSGSAKFQEFTLKKNTSSFTSTLTVNDNGSSFVSTVISYIMPHMEASKRAAMQALMLAEAIAIVKDSNGHYWMIGDNDNPLTNTAGTGETGTAKGDSNQYTVELTAETSEWPMEVTESAVQAVIAGE